MNKTVFSILLLFYLPLAAQASQLEKKRNLKVAQTKQALDRVQQKALHFEKVYKSVIGTTTPAAFSQDQILKIKSWSTSFIDEYNQLHEKLLDHEDEVYRLDRRISGNRHHEYKNEILIQNRLRVLTQVGSNYTQQRVKLSTFLENALDEINNRISDNPNGLASRNNAKKWASIISLMQNDPTKSPLPKIVLEPKKPAALPQKVLKPSPPKKLASQLPKKLPTKKAPRVIKAQPQPQRKIASLPSRRRPQRGTPPQPKLSCQRVPSSEVKKYRDGLLDLSDFLEGMRKLNILAFVKVRTPEQDLLRYKFYESFLTDSFFQQKLEINKIQIQSKEDKKRWDYLNYLAQVRMIHLYEEAIKKASGQLFSSAKGYELNEKLTPRFFSMRNSEVTDISLLGGDICKNTTSLKKVRNKCALSVSVRYGKEFVCNKEKLALSKADFTYYFRFNTDEKKWMLYDTLIPQIRRGMRKEAVFSEFRNKSFNNKETLSTLESWMQKGLNTMDLIGLGDYINRKRGIASQ